MPPVGAQPLIVLAKQVAGKVGIDPALVCAIVEQESAWNPWAVRYEPEFLARYVAPLFTNNKISATEAWTRSMSWGLMQVMGQVAREVGFSDRFLAGLCDPQTNLAIGCKVFLEKVGKAQGDISKALLLWNGGADASYAAAVLARRGTYLQ